jgi:hypothetical protein
MSSSIGDGVGDGARGLIAIDGSKGLSGEVGAQLIVGMSAEPGAQIFVGHAIGKILAQ